MTGDFPPFVGPKDLILHLIGRISAQGANFKVIEFHGKTIDTMSTSGRLVLCNMAVEAGRQVATDVAVNFNKINS